MMLNNIHNSPNKVYLSLGSNIGNSYYFILSGIMAISELESTTVTNISYFYTTDPVGFVDQDRFLNCAIEIETTLSPFSLLSNLQKIEIDMKRVRKFRWGPRTLDIDIIFYGDLKLDSEDLIIPHCQYHKRNFVLIPLLDIMKKHKNYDKIEALVDKKDKSVILEDKSKKDLNILVSSCLVGEDTTYKGSNNANYIFTDLLKDKFNYIKVCPEVEGGLSTPRTPAERYKDKVITKDNIDVTKEFYRGADISLKLAQDNNVLLGVFKGNSPSCGSKNIYDGTFSNNLIVGNGVASDLLIENGFDIIEVNKNDGSK